MAPSKLISRISFEKISFNILRWKTIKYTEERGILGLFDNWFNISNKVIQDFKKIMEQTKIIKDKILLKSKDIENNIFNKSYFAPKINKLVSPAMNPDALSFFLGLQSINTVFISRYPPDYSESP